MVGVLVDVVADDASCWAEKNVEKPEHGGPLTRGGLGERGEAVHVVRAEDGVDCELAAEGAGVGQREHEALQGEEDADGLAEGGGLDDLGFGDLDLPGGLGFEGRDGAFGGFFLVRVEFAAVGGGGVGGLCQAEFAAVGEVDDYAGGVDGGGVAGGSVAGGSGDHFVAVGPFAGWCVLAEEEHSQGKSRDEDGWNDEADSPGNMVGESSAFYQAVKDGGHDEVCDTTTCVTDTSHESICGAHDVLVEELHGPDLAWDEGTTENTDEEADGQHAMSRGNKTGHCCWNHTGEKEINIDESWTEAIAQWSNQSSYKKTVENREKKLAMSPAT